MAGQEIKRGDQWLYTHVPIILRKPLCSNGERTKGPPTSPQNHSVLISCLLSWTPAYSFQFKYCNRFPSLLSHLGFSAPTWGFSSTGWGKLSGEWAALGEGIWQVIDQKENGVLTAQILYIITHTYTTCTHILSLPPPWAEPSKLQRKQKTSQIKFETYS